MTRWAVKLEAPQQALLGDDLKGVGDLQQGPGGDTLLVFRDRFSALKVASRLGAGPVEALPPTDATHPGPRPAVAHAGRPPGGARTNAGAPAESG